MSADGILTPITVCGMFLFLNLQADEIIRFAFMITFNMLNCETFNMNFEECDDDQMSLTRVLGMHDECP